MTVCIVGHGWNMINSGLGEEIDKHDVVRMKLSKDLQSSNYRDWGKKTTYAGGTTAVIMEVIKQYPEAREYWAYIKRKHKELNDERDNIIFRKLDTYAEDWDRGKYRGHPIERLKVFDDIHFKWLEEYYKMRGTDRLRYSTGMGMIITVLDYLNEKKLYLAGFDSVLDPDNTKWSSKLSNKRYNWDVDPPHDFKMENKLLDMVLDHYEAEVVNLNG